MKKVIVSAATIAVLSTAYGVSASADSYIVQKGDTLGHIALKYHTSITELKKLNNLKSDLIYINQSLLVALPSSPTPTPIPLPEVTAPAAPAVTTYTVVSGDSLSKIAKNHSISLSNLLAWNNLTGHLIYPGNVLKVSDPSVNNVPVVTTPVVPIPVVPVPAPVVPLTPEPVTPAPIVTTAPANVTEYKVVSGDVLGRIALRFNTTVQELKSLNNLHSDLIYVGQVLKVTTALPAIPAETPATSSNSLIDAAKAVIGVPYLWGGTTTSGFDCSGFVYYVFNKAGQAINRLTAAGYYDRSYYVSDPQPGDLLFFENTYKKGISHLGIYLGGGQFIHSDNNGVRITSVNDNYYKQHFDGFKRLY
jgi:peptidoglycan DL-endopeptidase LytE